MPIDTYAMIAGTSPKTPRRGVPMPWTSSAPIQLGESWQRFNLPVPLNALTFWRIVRQGSLHPAVPIFIAHGDNSGDTLLILPQVWLLSDVSATAFTTPSFNFTTLNNGRIFIRKRLESPAIPTLILERWSN